MTTEMTEDSFDDEELAVLALAADPDAPLSDDAVPIDVYFAQSQTSDLPRWYMAPVAARHSGRIQRIVIMAVAGAFVLIEAFGLCSTYGQLPFH